MKGIIVAITSFIGLVAAIIGIVQFFGIYNICEIARTCSGAPVAGIFPTATSSPFPTTIPSPIPTTIPSPIPTATLNPIPTATLNPVPTFTSTPTIQARTWSAKHSLSPGSYGNYLYSVAALSTNNVWAVGSSANSHGHDKTLIEHWNGSTWTTVSSPNPGSYNNDLFSVAALAPDNIWAVGEYSNASDQNQTLIMHWNGSVWTTVTSPNPGSYSNELIRITALAPDDIWAVGDYSNNSDQNVETLIEYWNGANWFTKSSISPGTFNVLESISALTPSDIWAAGFFINSKTSQAETLIEHWNGSSWTSKPSPNPGSTNILLSITAQSSDNIWAVGGYLDSSGQDEKTLIELWNGSTWVTSPSLNPGSNYSELSSVTAIASDDIWAVGSYSNTSSNSQILIEHWNGANWNTSPSLNPGAFVNSLSCIVSPTSDDIWAVGDYNNTSNGPTQALIEQLSSG